MNSLKKNKNSVVLSLGTNLGDKEYNLKKAIILIEENGIVKNKSKLYLSEPWGYSSKNNFFNMGIFIQTDLNPLELLSFIKCIESKMGRKKADILHYQDRIIDVDILLFNELEHLSEELIIPHPKIKERIFSILILKDLFKNNLIPVFNETADSILAKTVDNSIVSIHKSQF